MKLPQKTILSLLLRPAKFRWSRAWESRACLLWQLVQDLSGSPDHAQHALPCDRADGVHVLLSQTVAQQELAHLVDVVPRVRQVYLVVGYDLQRQLLHETDCKPEFRHGTKTAPGMPQEWSTTSDISHIEGLHTLQAGRPEHALTLFLAA